MTTQRDEQPKPGVTIQPTSGGQLQPLATQRVCSKTRDGAGRSAMSAQSAPRPATRSRAAGCRGLIWCPHGAHSTRDWEQLNQCCVVSRLAKMHVRVTFEELAGTPRNRQKRQVRAHNPEVAGSNPAPATTKSQVRATGPVYHSVEDPKLGPRPGPRGSSPVCCSGSCFTSWFR